MSPEDRLLAVENLGTALRRLREQAGVSVRAASEALGWSSSKLSRIETSSSGVKPHDLDRLLDRYHVPAEMRSKISRLAESTPRRRRPRGAAHTLPDVYERYAGLEEQAEHISIYAAVLVQGLLQTPEYAAQIFRATPLPEGQFAKTRLERRMSRQAILGKQPPVRLTVVLDEAVLRRTVGGPAVMRRQLIRLQELNDRPETSINVLPFAAGAHPATGQFTILDFPADSGISPQVFSDDLNGGLLRGRPDELERYRACFHTLRELSVELTDFLRYDLGAISPDAVVSTPRSGKEPMGRQR